MDNFAWVNELADRLEEQGQQRLAHLIHDLPYQKYLGNHALVEALTPEALAAARSLEIPWLEVYFKHWLCASRIARHQGEQLLGDVVAAYEGAHQDRTQGCPQSVCVTQDLVGTYANVDGPGWAHERLAACDETLSRIDPSWNCFGCLTIERANAMGDLGQRREALAYLKSQRDAQDRAGEEPGTLYVTTEVEQWLSLGEAHKALALLDETEDDSDEDDPEEQAARLMQRCRALAMAGQPGAAWEQLPDFADVEVTAYVHWARAAVAAARALAERNTAALGHALWTVTEHLHTAGSHRLRRAGIAGVAGFGGRRGPRWRNRHPVAGTGSRPTAAGQGHRHAAGQCAGRFRAGRTGPQPGAGHGAGGARLGGTAKPLVPPVP
jgi:hypothetical protein